jgi:hypothetical protein
MTPFDTLSNISAIAPASVVRSLALGGSACTKGGRIEFDQSGCGDRMTPMDGGGHRPVLQQMPIFIDL